MAWSGAAALCVANSGVITASTLEDEQLTVVSFYKFAHIPDFASKRKALVDLCKLHLVAGGIILAPEGINGSICGRRNAVAEVLANIQQDARLANLRTTTGALTSGKVLENASDNAFRWGHVRVKLKKEVVPLGVPGVDPAARVGKYVKPAEWNQLISDPDTIVIDVRNAYETRLGRFKGAIDPGTESFREFPEWCDALLLRDKTAQTRKVATYCTGGIRCEKATAFLIQQGFKEVYHLSGGILKYLEEVDRSDSLWEGECFVFDKRVSVEHGLLVGKCGLCYACKEPVTEQDMSSAEWEEGVSCPHCFLQKSQAEKDRARARHSQFQQWGALGGPGKKCSA